MQNKIRAFVIHPPCGSLVVLSAFGCSWAVQGTTLWSSSPFPSTRARACVYVCVCGVYVCVWCVRVRALPALRSPPIFILISVCTPAALG
eukprot:NODE_4154_length_604_cov_143.457658_g2991_i0.p4 GENE.NODE_4154_length_604_cov_143.457658_g2991_i0~~NODE_4154_length_604_cov_143.457658_g2991_i0.p4  ORF type:complete len:90 (-),score=3.38 NODE_4154_length_604_cov_143.457658_g2991_i0:170-439(-)